LVLLLLPLLLLVVLLVRRRSSSGGTARRQRWRCRCRTPVHLIAQYTEQRVVAFDLLHDYIYALATQCAVCRLGRGE
jgi:hypothetical protein